VSTLPIARGQAFMEDDEGGVEVDRCRFEEKEQ